MNKSVNRFKLQSPQIKQNLNYTTINEAPSYHKDFSTANDQHLSNKQGTRTFSNIGQRLNQKIKLRKQPPQGGDYPDNDMSSSNSLFKNSPNATLRMAKMHLALGKQVNLKPQLFDPHLRTMDANNNSTMLASKTTLNGIDNSFDNISPLIDSLYSKLQLETKRVIERDDLTKIAKMVGVQLSPYQAMEVLFFSRDCTQDPTKFSLELLKSWFCRNLPLLRPRDEFGFNKSTINQESVMDLDQYATGTNHSKSIRNHSVTNQMRNPSPFLQNAYGSATPIDFSQRQTYADFNFKHQLHDTMKNLSKLPQLRKNIQLTINDWQTKKDEEGASLGIKAANRARSDVKIYNRRQGQEQEALLRKFIENEPNACHATNLYRLLTKKWSENPSSYRICSRLTPKKEKRIKDILVENRYSS